MGLFSRKVNQLVFFPFLSAPTVTKPPCSLPQGLFAKHVVCVACLEPRLLIVCANLSSWFIFCLRIRNRDQSRDVCHPDPTPLSARLFPGNLRLCMHEWNKEPNLAVCLS